MTPEQLKAARERLGWTRRQLAEALNAAMGTDYSPDRIVGRWERGERRVPDNVAAFLRELEMETVLPGEPGPLEDELDSAAAGPDFSDVQTPPEDSAPPSPDDEPGLRLLPPSSGAHARVCEELWEMVATGLGLAGVVLNSDALKADRDVILADKKALGAAYGKLAEQNETFRRMLLGMSGGGAWLEVALVTGITAGKVQRNHQAAREARAAQLAAEAEELRHYGPEPEPGVMYGDEAVVSFPA